MMKLGRPLDTTLPGRVMIAYVVYPAIVAGAALLRDEDWTTFTTFRVMAALAVALMTTEQVLLAGSARARELLGPKFWIIYWNGTGMPWSLVMILALWPNDLAEVGVHSVIWLAAGGLFSALLAVLMRGEYQNIRDYADELFDLEKYRTGNWAYRQGSVYWPLVWVPLIVGLMFGVNNISDKDTDWDLFYPICMAVLYCGINGGPRDAKWKIGIVDAPRLLGLLVICLAAFTLK